MEENLFEIFVSRCGVTKPFEKVPVFGGRNSEVWRLSNPDGDWILKNYCQHGNGGWDRLGTEFCFLKLLRDTGMGDNTPVPLRMDRELFCALYSFLPGDRIQTITNDFISQAARFINDINQLRTLPEVHAIPVAADACFSLREHLTLAERCVGRLKNQNPESELEGEVCAFVKKQLQPFLLRLKAGLFQGTQTLQLDAPLLWEERILSPSDFGFHNMLECKDNLFFVDFEYAGWDDPAKLICDFMCQPDIPVSVVQGQKFMEEVLVDLSQQSRIRQRVECLLPVHRLKWCCVLLNEFRAEGRMRRLHAGMKLDGLLREQLSKAIKYFEMHLASTN